MAFPSSPTNNQTATVNGIRYYYSSAATAWIRVTSTLAKYTVATSSPAAPEVGDQWYDSSTDILYEYMSDGTTSYWIDVQSLGLSGNILVPTTITDSTLTGNITVSAPNFYSIGTLAGPVGNVFANNITLTSNVTAAYHLGDGSKLTKVATTGKAIAMSIVFGG